MKLTWKIVNSRLYDWFPFGECIKDFTRDTQTEAEDNNCASHIFQIRFYYPNTEKLILVYESSIPADPLEIEV